MRTLFKLITKPLGCLFSFVLGLLLLVVLLVVGVVVFVDHFGVEAGSQWVSQRTGFALDVGQQNINLFQGLVDLQKTRVVNSNQFPALDFAEFNQLKVQADPWSLAGGRIVISEAVVDLDSVSLVRNQAGVFNAVAFADALNPPATSSTSGSFTTKQVPPYLIKQLTIRVGTVKYFDFDGHDGQPQSQTVNYAQTFTDVTDFKTQVAPALARKFTPVAVAMIGNAVFNSLVNTNTYLQGAMQASGLAWKTGEQVFQTVGSGVGSALQNLFK